MKDRIKKIRRELDLTQQEFAERLGIKRGAIANYEIGRNAPADSIVSLICREFNVDENWLRSGRGDMFRAIPDAALEALSKEYNYSQRDYVIVKTFSNLSRKDRDIILDFVMEVAGECSVVPGGTAADDIDAEVADYRRQLELQKKAEGESSASNTSEESMKGKLEA